MSKRIVVEGPSAPAITLTLDPTSTSASLRQAIRSHFRLGEKTPFILTDSEGNDVVTDLTLPNGTYKLNLPQKSQDVEMTDAPKETTTPATEKEKTKEVEKDTKKKSSKVIKSEEKFASLYPLLDRKSPFSPSGFQPGASEALDYFGKEVSILVVGAGGLGCELLKNLALSGFKDIHVIDMDTIDVSNLNRQFLFRLKDTEKYKADVAAEFIMKRCKDVKVTSYKENIMTFDKEWYQQFRLVIAGLDNIEARDWLNRMLLDCVEFDENGQVNWDTIIPLIDGGTTGWQGQARVVIPYQTACYRCSLASLPPEAGFHLCTIASKPRKPEHCIAYALIVEWSRLLEFKTAKDFKLGKEVTVDADGTPQVTEGSVKLDKDNAEHMKWITDRATERAEKFGIKGVTYFMSMQVVKNIIPALASTNAVISAACVTESFKILAQSHPHMDCYWQFNGNTGIYTKVFPYARQPDCDVCCSPLVWTFKSSDLLQALVDKVFGLFPLPPSKEETDEDDVDEKGKKKQKVKPPTISLGDGTIVYTTIGGMDYSAELKEPLFARGIVNKTMLIATNGQRTRRIFVKIGK